MQTTLPHLIPGSDLSDCASPKAASRERRFAGFRSLISKNPRQKLIVALDVPRRLAAHKNRGGHPETRRLSIKSECSFTTAEGPQLVRDLVASAGGSFSISNITTFPRQWRRRCTKRPQLGVSMLTVHASGSGKMLHAAVDSARATNPALIALGVTVADQPRRK